LFISLKQQSRQRPPTLDGFAFAPNRTVFLDGIVRLSKLDSEASAAALHLRPTFRSKRDPSPTEEE
jgi:hypothetical protein